MNDTKPALPEPFDYCYEWDGPYGTRKFSAAAHNGMKPARSVPIYRADQMHAYADQCTAAAQARIAELRGALRNLLERDERNTCAHEETYRGGVLWEICSCCGAKWADDEGGKPEWQDPPEWTAARAALATTSGAEPADPMDTPLPCDVKVGNGTHRKGTSLRTLVARMKMLHEAAFGPEPTQAEKDANLAALQAAASPPVVQPEATIDTADHVLHRPTGETWVVAFAENGRVCACGWPCTLVPVSDCELTKKATPAERDKLLREIARMGGSDVRKDYAVRALAAKNGAPNV